MGLLDDAIREHLELKRRRGADPSDIARLEHEALGPVRREPFESASQKSGPHTEADVHSAAFEPPSELGESEYEEYDEEEYYEDAEAADWGEPIEEDFERPGSGPLGTEPPPAAPDRAVTESPPEHDVERGIRRWRRSRRESIPPEEAPPTQAAPPAQVPPEDETVEYGVDDGLDAGGGTQGEGPPAEPPEREADVLEETPEFLQDAPEHDRLWFEQRPPRDFDFDD